eukprot:scaffold284112_cov28-Tisochrysis_lutea.AAC.4
MEDPAILGRHGGVCVREGPVQNDLAAKWRLVQPFRPVALSLRVPERVPVRVAPCEDAAVNRDRHCAVR